MRSSNRTWLRVLAFARAYIEDNGVSPTYEEIANALGISRQRVGQIVLYLEKHGYLRRVKDGHRYRILEVLI